MAVTIVRTPWIDDDGTGTTGTVINNAVKTALYNDIDGGYAKLAQLTGGNAFTGNQAIAGLLNVTAFGTHSFTGSGSGPMQFLVRNSLAGAGNFTLIGVGNDNANPLGYLAAYSSTSGAAGYTQPSGISLLATGTGGLSIVSYDPAGAVRFYTNQTERMRIAATGEVLIGTLTNPLLGQ